MISHQKHHPEIFKFAKFASLLLMFLPSVINAQISGRAPLLNPTGGFNIDGHVTRNPTTVFTGGDWRAATEALRLLNISSGSGITSVVTPVDGSATAFIRDPWNTTTDKIFTSGSKFDDGVSALKWSNGKATAKNDIHNGMFHIGIDANGDRWLLMAGDRYSNDGTSYIDFEFLQRTIKTDAGGGFSYVEPANDPDLPPLGAGKSEKDFVLSMEYSNGGTTANVFLYVWESLGNNKWGYVKKTIPSGVSYAQTNTSLVPVDFGAFGLTNYDPYVFVEAAVNISKLYKDVINSGYNDCSGAVYKSMFIKTKASDALTAALKDFIEPQSINLVFDEVSFSYPPVCTNVASGTITPTITGGTPENPAYSSSSSNLVIDGTTGAILSALAAGTYTVTVNFQLGSCAKTEQASVTVTQLPSATFSYATPFCVTATNISPTISQGASIGTFSSSPTLSGLNSSTGVISAFSGANAYTITNTISASGGCPAVSYSQQIVVTALPDASFSYPQTSYCIATGTILPTIVNPQPPGSFTANMPGLALTGTTGAIDLGASSAGTYTVTYTIPAGGGCPAVPYSRSITLNNTPGLNLEGDGKDEICQGTTSASIAYSSPFGNPDKYSIDFVSGIPDITDASFGGGALGISNIPGNINAGTYTGTLTLETPAGCNSAPFSVYVVVNAATSFQLQTQDPLTVCPYETIEVCGPANAGYEYLWSNGTTSQCANYTLGICGSTITPTLYLTDENGCQSQATLTFTAVDTEAPVFTNLPPNVTISDGDPLPTGVPTVTDNCMENIQVTKNDVTEEKNCIKVIKRTFTATDECGNSVSYTQLIIIKDDTPPVITNCGTVTTNLNCGAALPSPGLNLPVVEAGASLYSTDKVVASLNGCGTHNIERVWTVIDAAGNTNTCTQYYNYQLPPPAQNSMIQKDQISTAAKPTGPASIKKQLQLKAYPNPYTHIVNFSFTPHRSGYAVLDLVDLTGRRVATVFKGNVIEGQAKTVSYDNKSGIKVPLVYRLTIGNEIKSGKILPLKN